MSQAKERVLQLQKRMKEEGIDAYLVPTSDYHESEYVGEYFSCRQYLTGFTGSAGTALVLGDWAGLWTDGRYFVQAVGELSESGIELMRQGQPEVPGLEDYLEKHLPEGGVLGFDGRVVNAQMGEKLKALVEPKNGSVVCQKSLIDDIWENRPAMSAQPAWILKEQYAGVSAEQKIEDLRTAIKQEKATVHLLTTLDDIVWLLNIRGNDTPCLPVVLSYLAVKEQELVLFANPQVFDEEVAGYLQKLGVAVQPYDAFYSYVKELRDETVLLEKSRVNYAVLENLDGSNLILDRLNPTVPAKAKKNPVEIENMKRAHIKDGVAMTKFIYWVKQNIGKIPMTECSVADHLEQLRKEQGCLDLSFTTISAYGSNAAMCHYHAERENCAQLKPQGLYLVDSGGQYLEGTTDVTRTFALGPVTEEEKEHYTLVLIGMLRLGNVRFLKGCSGLSLDYAAREELWKRGLDYNHGTGHGVGYLLNVHERPVGIRFRMVPERQDSAPFEPGMVCSDEPGIYIEGSHGIRTENLFFCKEDEKNEYGQFLRFEFLTYVPIDLEPVAVSLMEQRDLDALNEYHRQVYEKIAPHLTKEEADWLREVTAPVQA